MQDASIGEWLSVLAAKNPTPGGGAVAALAAAVSAAQLQMVAVYTTGPKWQDQEQHMNTLSGELTNLRAQALELAKEDEAVFAEVSKAYQMPKENEDQKATRQEAIQKAVTAAAVPPTKTAQLAIRLLDIAGELADSGNPNVISDVSVGAFMARASLESAIVNIEINERSIKDEKTKHKLQTIIKDALTAIKQADSVTDAVRLRIGQM